MDPWGRAILRIPVGYEKDPDGMFFYHLENPKWDWYAQGFKIDTRDPKRVPHDFLNGWQLGKSGEFTTHPMVLGYLNPTGGHRSLWVSVDGTTEGTGWGLLDNAVSDS